MTISYSRPSLVEGRLLTFGRGGIDHFIPPAFVLAWDYMAVAFRLRWSSMLEGLESEYSSPGGLALL